MRSDNKLSTSIILDQTLIDLLKISEKEGKYLWSSFERLRFSDLNLSSQKRERLNQFYIYSDDSLECILSLSIGYIYGIWSDKYEFNEIIKNVLDLIRDLLNHEVSLKISGKKGSPRKCFPDDNLNILNGLIIYPMLVPQELINSLQKYGISKWNDLLELTEGDVIKKFGFNYTSISLLYNLWVLCPWAKAMSSFLSPVVNERDKYPSHSLASILKNWIVPRAGKERDAEVLMHRMGWVGTGNETLESIAQMYQLTKERVRQIVEKLLEKLNHHKPLKELKPLWVIIDSFVQENGGIIFLSDLAQCLKNYFNWNEAPTDIALINLVDFEQNEIFKKGKSSEKLGIILSKNFTCDDCNQVCDFLSKKVVELGEINLFEASKLMNKFCKTQCTEEEKTFYPNTKALLNYFTDVNACLKDSVRLKRDKLFSVDKWNMKYGRLISVAEGVLKYSNRAMHFTEIYAEIKKLRPEDSSLKDRNVHATLDRSENVLLWDRGTFIHIENAVFPYGLIREIETWLTEKLSGNIPFISAYGAFKAFKKKCIEVGIPSEVALYSCLKLSDDPLFAYPKLPYIYRKKDGAERIPLPLIMEDFIRVAEGTVPLKTLRKYAVETIHLKDFMLSQLIDRTPNIVRSENGSYLHTDYLNIDRDALANIVSHAENLVSKEEHVSVARVFNDKKINCKLMGIDNPVLLFSVLQLYASEIIQAIKYPQLLSIDSDDTKSKGILKEVTAYIKKKQDFCTFEELEETFVNKLGYLSNTIRLVAYKENIYRYLQGCLIRCLIHHDTIGWDKEKQKQIEEIALKRIQRWNQIW